MLRSVFVVLCCSSTMGFSQYFPDDFLSLPYARYTHQYPGGREDLDATEKLHYIELAEFLQKTGDTYALLGNNEEAIKKYEEALTHYAYGELYYQYAICLFKIESYSQSIAAFKIASFLGVQGNAEEYGLIARAYSILKNADLAFEYLDLAIIRGYRDIDEIQQHPDFIFLQEHDRWQDWFAQHEALLFSVIKPQHEHLIAEWLFDGTAHDHSGNGHHATIHGAQWSSEGGLVFNGKDDYVAVANHPDLNPRKEITISAWYKPVSFKGMGSDAIIQKPYVVYEQPVFQYHLGACGDQYSHNQRAFLFCVSIAGQRQQIQTPAGFYNIGLWYLLTGTYNGTELCLYINDQLLARQPVNGLIDQYDTPLWIGGFSILESKTPGTIDDVRVYNKALSFEEIKQIYYQDRLP